MKPLSVFSIELALISFIAIILTAHFLVPEDYNWLENSISDMAAQQYLYAWIMRTGLITYGAMIAIVMWKSYAVQKRRNYGHIAILIYGVAVILSGVFSTKPFWNVEQYSELSDLLHSVFAQIAGVSFTIAIAIHFFYHNTPGDRRFHLFYFVLVVICSVGVGLAANNWIPIGMGLIQRLLYLVSFIWLYQEYKTNLKVD